MVNQVIKVSLKHWNYLRYVMWHKWFVFLACCRYGIWWKGLVHDLSKFLPSEWFPYAEHFYGKGRKGIQDGRDKTGYYKPYDTGDAVFDFAWFLHQKRNKHHWQYWIMPKERKKDVRVLRIPDVYVKEMVADWIGASRAQKTTGSPLDWYNTNKNKMILHQETKEMVWKLLQEV